MEEKLDINHVQHYLGTNLQMMFEKSGRTIILNGLFINENGNLVFVDVTGEKFFQKHWNFKPLLHPLERLTMPELKEYGPEYQYHEETLRVVLSAAKNGSVMRLNYDFVDFLFSKHYDVFGLIPKDLALPIDPK